MSCGRHTVRLPQGKYPRGHEALSSDVLSAVDKGKKKSIDLIKNAVFPALVYDEDVRRGLGRRTKNVGSMYLIIV